MLDSGIDQALLPVAALKFNVGDRGKSRYTHSSAENPALEIHRHESYMLTRVRE